MTDNNSLYSEPKAPDEFRTESPLRGFAEYQEFGGYLIAKGFRPSLQHLVRYLGAMEAREGYRLIQVLEADTGVPTMIFRTTARAPLDQVADAFKPAELQRSGATMSYVSAEFGDTGKTIEKELNRLLAKGFTDIREWKISAAHPDAPREEGKPGYSPDNWPYVSDFETDDEDEPWRLIVKFKDKRATFFRGDRRDGVDIPADALKGNETYEKMMEAFLNQPVTVDGVKVERKIAMSAALGAGYGKAEREEETAEVLGTITDWTPPGGTVHGFWQDGRFFIDFPAAVSQGHAIAVGPPGYVFYGFKQDNPAVAFYVKIDEEVTSDVGKVEAVEQVYIDGKPIPPAIVQNPVDILESMSEEIAEELGIGVDRESFQLAREHLAETVPAKFDDANPEHYNGWECGDIGERLSANGYQILKYCWRLGKKDDPCKELGKALRYLERERDLMTARGGVHIRATDMRGIKHPDDFFDKRIAGQSEFTARVAFFLWHGYKAADIDKLKAIIADHKATLDCGHGLAI